MISRARKIALGGVVGTVIVTVVSLLGPELFSSWWNSDRDRADAESRQIHLEAIREQTEVISNLRDAISALQDGRATAPSAPEESSLDEVHQDVTAPAEPGQSISGEDDPVSVVVEEQAVEEPEVAALPADDRKPAQPAPEPPTAAEPPASEEAVAVAGPVSLPQFGDVVGVFENEPFTLCGHEEFRANVRDGADGQRLHVASRNRSVPGAGFRGYETLLPLEQAVQLWEGCVVAAAVTSSPGGRRILISMGEQ